MTFRALARFNAREFNLISQQRLHLVKTPVYSLTQYSSAPISSIPARICHPSHQLSQQMHLKPARRTELEDVVLPFNECANEGAGPEQEKSISLVVPRELFDGVQMLLDDILDFSVRPASLALFLRFLFLRLCILRCGGVLASLLVIAERWCVSHSWDVRSTFLGCGLDVALVDYKGLNGGYGCPKSVFRFWEDQ